jgi:PCI domain
LILSNLTLDLSLHFWRRCVTKVNVGRRTTNVPKQLNVDANEVEELLIDLILEGKIDGKIDQVNMRLELDKQYVSHKQLDHALAI